MNLSMLKLIFCEVELNLYVKCYKWTERNRTKHLHDLRYKNTEEIRMVTITIHLNRIN